MIEVQNLIETCLINVMSSVAFTDVALDKKSPKVTPKSDWITLKIAVLMPFLGDVVVSMPSSLAKKLAQNMLDELDRGGQIEYDVVAEILNVLVGKIFCEVSPQLLFEIGLPEPLVVKDEKLLMKYESYLFKTVDGENLLLYHNLNLDQLPQ